MICFGTLNPMMCCSSKSPKSLLTAYILHLVMLTCPHDRCSKTFFEQIWTTQATLTGASRGPKRQSFDCRFKRPECCLREGKQRLWGPWFPILTALGKRFAKELHELGSLRVVSLEAPEQGSTRPLSRFITLRTDNADVCS